MWTVLYGAEIALGVYLFRFIPRRYPAFAAFIAFGVASNLILFSLWHEGRLALYAQAWMWKRSLGIVVYLALGLELLCPKYRRLWPLGWIPATYLFTHFSLPADRVLHAWIPALAIVAYAHKHPLAKGLLVSTLFPVIAESAQALQIPLIQYVPMVCHSVALGMWLGTFRRDQEFSTRDIASPLPQRFRIHSEHKSAAL